MHGFLTLLIPIASSPIFKMIMKNDGCKVEAYVTLTLLKWHELSSINNACLRGKAFGPDSGN